MKKTLRYLLLLVIPIPLFSQDNAGEPFPGAKHKYTQGCDYYVPTGSEKATGEGCPACANNRYHNNNARKAEEKRVADITAARHAAKIEAQKKAAAKEQAERLADSEKMKENTLYVGFGPSTASPSSRDLNYKPTNKWISRFEPGTKRYGYVDKALQYFEDNEVQEKDWKIKPAFTYEPENFNENDYAEITTHFSNSEKELKGPAGYYYNYVRALINRKGEVILTGAPGEKFHILRKMPFAIKMTQYTSSGDASSGTLYNLKKKEAVQQLPVNTSGNEYVSDRFQYHYFATEFFLASDEKYVTNPNWHSVRISLELEAFLRKEFANGKFSAAFFYATSTADHPDYAGFFLSNDGSVKAIATISYTMMRPNTK